MLGNPIMRTMLLLGIALLTGCVSNNTKESFKQIDAEVVRRTGRTIDWLQIPADTGTAMEQVDRLLKNDLDLEAAVKIALLRNPKLQILYESIGIAEAEVVKAMLPPNPVMEIGHTRTGDHGHTWEFNLVQELVGMIMIPQHRKTAEAEAAQVRSQVTAGVLDLILDVKVAFRRVQAAQQTLGMLEKTLKSDQAAHEMARRLREAGNITKLEMQGHKAVLEQTKMAIFNAELKRNESRERLNVLLGVTHDRIHWHVTETLPEIREEQLTCGHIEAAALRNSLDLEMARLEWLRARRHGSMVRYTSVMPAVELAMESERKAGGKWEWGPLLAFPLPLFDRGRPGRTVADANIRRAASHETLVRNRLGAATRLTVRRLETRHEQAMRYKHTIIPLKKELTEETQRHFNAMQVGVFQLLTAKKEELRAKRSYIKALARYWVARAEADHLMSGRIPMVNVDMAPH